MLRDTTAAGCSTCVIVTVGSSLTRSKYMLFLQQQQSLMLISVNMMHTSGLMAKPETVCCDSQSQAHLDILRIERKPVHIFRKSDHILTFSNSIHL